jgi:hypothetical protein
MRMHLAPRGRQSDRLRPSDLGFVARREGFEPSNRQIPRTPPSGRGGVGYWEHEAEDGYWGFRYRDPVTGEQAATLLEELLRRHGVQRVVVRLGFDTVVVGGLGAGGRPAAG